jgi:hypothetical protein
MTPLRPAGAANTHRPWWCRLLHIHYDPTWQTIGSHCYEQCRCGARRVTRAHTNIMGPVATDWPSQRDLHGVHRDSSSWRYGTWQTSGYPDTGVRVRDSAKPPEDFDG